MSWRSWLSWFADSTAQQILGAILGSAVLTSLVSAIVRSATTLSWEWSWVLWTSTALVSYVALLKATPWWLPKVQAAEKRFVKTVDSPPQLDADRRELQAKRERLIKDWRAMIHAVHKEMLDDLGSDGTTVAGYLERRPEFLTLRPHLTNETLRMILGGRTWVASPSASTMSGSLHFVLSEIDALEKRWGLV